MHLVSMTECKSDNWVKGRMLLCAEWLARKIIFSEISFSVPLVRIETKAVTFAAQLSKS